MGFMKPDKPDPPKPPPDPVDQEAIAAASRESTRARFERRRGLRILTSGAGVTDRAPTARKILTQPGTGFGG